MPRAIEGAGERHHRQHYSRMHSRCGEEIGGAQRGDDSGRGVMGLVFSRGAAQLANSKLSRIMHLHTIYPLNKAVDRLEGNGCGGLNRVWIVWNRKSAAKG